MLFLPLPTGYGEIGSNFTTLNTEYSVIAIVDLCQSIGTVGGWCLAQLEIFLVLRYALHRKILLYWALPGTTHTTGVFEVSGSTHGLTPLLQAEISYCTITNYSKCIPQIVSTSGLKRLTKLYT